jgi:hypothetical protein
MNFGSAYQAQATKSSAVFALLIRDNMVTKTAMERRIITNRIPVALA